jgi:uncharacterized protein YndB with AHSA1/START domain
MEITREIELDAPPEEVWRALTDPDELEQWFANDVELEPEVGGEGTFRWDDGDERHAVVEEVDPERRFAFTWDGGHVVIELEEIPAGTRVVVIESPNAEWSSALELRARASALSRSGRGKAATSAPGRLRRAYADHLA